MAAIYNMSLQDIITLVVFLIVFTVAMIYIGKDDNIRRW